MKNANWVVVAILGVLFLAEISAGAIFLGNQNIRGWGMMGLGMMNGWLLGFFSWIVSLSAFKVALGG